MVGTSIPLCPFLRLQRCSHLSFQLLDNLSTVVSCGQHRSYLSLSGSVRRRQSFPFRPLNLRPGKSLACQNYFHRLIFSIRSRTRAALFRHPALSSLHSTDMASFLLCVRPVPNPGYILHVQVTQSHNVESYLPKPVNLSHQEGDSAQWRFKSYTLYVTLCFFFSCGSFDIPYVDILMSKRVSDHPDRIGLCIHRFMGESLQLPFASNVCQI